MRLPVALLAAATALLVTTSGCVMRTTPTFDPLGKKVDRYADKPVDTVDEVRVFTDTAPPGFQLRDGALIVEPGHQHRIVGRVTVKRNGSCKPVEKARSSVISTLRREAFTYGGNAVVYATTPIRENATATELCKMLGDEASVGTGWVVVLADRGPRAAPAPDKAKAPASDKAKAPASDKAKAPAKKAAPAAETSPAPAAPAPAGP
jgi:hypothetical protein